MKVDAVSGIGFRNSNINFGEKQRAHEVAPVSKPSGVSDLAKVPVIVLLAMNPATLNSAIQTMPETDNPNKITILAPETKSSDALTYVISPEVEELQQDEPDFILPSSTQTILYIKDFKYLNHTYKMVCTSDAATSSNTMDNIYMYKDNQKMHPANVIGLVQHQVENGNDFVGAILSTEVYKDNKLKGVIHSEIELPKQLSDFIYSVIDGKTKFKNSLNDITLYKSSSPVISSSKIVAKYD